MRHAPLDLPWVLVAGAAFVVAAVFSVVTPYASDAEGLRHVVLRWFHAFVWTLLGLAALIRGFLAGSQQLAEHVAQLGVVVYLVYLVAFVQARSQAAG